MPQDLWVGRALLLILILTLAACGRKDDPATASDVRLPPGLESRFWPPDGFAYGVLKMPDWPAVRYGVAAPVAEPRADVIIMTGQGERLETWFETARALVEDDYTVWMIEAARGAKDFEPDIVALPVFERLIVRPRRPPLVIASGTADLAALTAVERGYRPAAVILSDPLGPPPASGAWVRPRVRVHSRDSALATWAIANPDLREGGPSAIWTRERKKLQDQTLAGLTHVRVPLTAITRAKDVFPCQSLNSCQEVVAATQTPYPIAPDSAREPWLSTLKTALGSGSRNVSDLFKSERRP